MPLVMLAGCWNDNAIFMGTTSFLRICFRIGTIKYILRLPTEKESLYVNGTFQNSKRTYYFGILTMNSSLYILNKIAPLNSKFVNCFPILINDCIHVCANNTTKNETLKKLQLCISFAFSLVELFRIVIIKYQGPKLILNGQDLVLMTTFQTFFET